nr:NADH dehydrogenase subunit 5 [Orientocreadium sp. HS]
MVYLSAFFLVGSLVFWFFDWVGWLVSFFLFSYPWASYPFLAMVDSISMVCSFMLLCCGFIALFYCYHYFGGGTEAFWLFLLIVWFLFIMFFLIHSFSLLFSLILWEYLGLVSFFLILFYSNMVSLRASLVTLFASRFGDVSMFALILWSGWLLVDCCWIAVGLVMLVILTKSACYPFISWLIEAMRAPTPVSSLVHSSTLVAAGVWFLLRYSFLLNHSVMSFLLVFCFVTILISGLSAVVFVDLKKIVALSTCNNVSWCIVFFICGDLGLSLLQLLTHGVCKCYLFMSVGDLMLGSLGSQDSKSVYLSRYFGLFGPMLQYVLVFSLCGLPFLGVFFGKHGLFSSVFYCYGCTFICFLLLCFTVSYMYSFRFFLMLLGDSLGMPWSYSSNFYSIGFLVLLATLLNYFGVVVFFECVSLSSFNSLLILILEFTGCMLGAMSWLGLARVSQSASTWSSSLWGGDLIVSWFYRSFSFFSSLFVLGLYRWEVFFLKILHNNGSVVIRSISNNSFLSLNFMVFGILVLVVLAFLLFC